VRSSTLGHAGAEIGGGVRGVEGDVQLLQKIPKSRKHTSHSYGQRPNGSHFGIDTKGTQGGERAKECSRIHLVGFD
jgi:hypothetical protein